MKKKMRYLAIAAAIAVLMSAGGCGKQEVVETATDVAAVESASDIVATTVGTEQTTTVSSTSAQEEITLVTATEPTTAEKAVETAKATQNTTKKTNAKATTTKATVKSTQKATTKATTKKTTTTKAQGLTDEDYQWVLNEALKYIKTLPKAEIDKTASAYSFERIFVNHLKARNAALNNLKEAIDVEYKSFCWDGGIGMNIELCKDDVGDYYYKLRYIAYIN